MNNELKFLEGLGKNNKIETSEIKIDGNVIRFNKETIQISNVSQFSINKPAMKIPYIAAIICFFSLYLLDKSTGIAILLLLLSGGYIFYVVNQNMNSGSYLTFYQNSGKIYQIHVQDEDFLREIRDVLEDRFNNKLNNATIHLDNKTIVNGHVAVGNHNNINESGTQVVQNQDSYNTDSYNTHDDHSSVTVSDSQFENAAIGNKGNVTIDQSTQVLDWTEIESELRKAINDLPANSEAKMACYEALLVCKNQDEGTLKQTVRKFKDTFTSELFIGVASGFLSNLFIQFIQS